MNILKIIFASSDASILCLPSVHTHSLSRRSFSCTAPSVWNNLSCKITGNQTHLSNHLWNFTSLSYPTVCACTCARLFWQRLFVLCFVMGYMLQFWETALKEYSVINNATVQERLTNTSELITAERPLVPDLLFWNYKKKKKKKTRAHAHTHTHTRTNSKHWFTTSFEEEGAVKRCSECDTHTHPPPKQRLEFPICLFGKQ